jgi:hypothetical protein
MNSGVEMSVPVAVMVDTIHANAGEIPTDANVVKYVEGYVSGSPDIRWQTVDWQRFNGHGQRMVRNYQGNGALLDVKSFDVLDVEEYPNQGSGQWTVTPTYAAELIQERVKQGVVWTTIYANDYAIALVVDAVKKLGGNGLFDGHLNCILADWNLNEQEAAAKLGTFIHGVSCVGVQWASPTSNPNTLLPGTNRTLSETNCDLNVVDANWIPSGGFSPIPSPAPVPAPTPVPKPVPAPVPTQTGLLVVDVNGTLIPKTVHSSDGGKTWT